MNKGRKKGGKEREGERKEGRRAKERKAKKEREKYPPKISLAASKQTKMRPACNGKATHPPTVSPSPLPLPLRKSYVQPHSWTAQLFINVSSVTILH